MKRLPVYDTHINIEGEILRAARASNYSTRDEVVSLLKESGVDFAFFKAVAGEILSENGLKKAEE